MSQNLEEIKRTIQAFIGRNDETLNLRDKNEPIWVNERLYQLEVFLAELRKGKDNNRRLDITINSPSILRSFRQNSFEPYKPEDYQYCLLHHLALKFEPGKSLYRFVDSFVETYKSNFRWTDIVITSSGATRCKTNIRFALNTLRYWGWCIITVIIKGEVGHHRC